VKGIPARRGSPERTFAGAATSAVTAAGLSPAGGLILT